MQQEVIALKWIKYILSFIIVVFLLCSCSQKITQGEIYDKIFYPAHTELISIPIIQLYGEDIYTTYQYCSQDYPDQWVICIRQMNNEGKYDIASYYVSEALYNSVDIGDEFAFE